MNIFQQIASTVKGWVSPPETKETTVAPAKIQNLNRQFSDYVKTQKTPLWNSAGNLSATQIVNNQKTIEAPTFKQNFAKSYAGISQQFSNFLNTIKNTSENPSSFGLNIGPKIGFNISGVKPVNDFLQKQVEDFSDKWIYDPKTNRVAPSSVFYAENAAKIPQPPKVRNPETEKQYQDWIEHLIGQSMMMAGITSPMKDVSLGKGGIAPRPSIIEEYGSTSKNLPAVTQEFRKLPAPKKLSYLLGAFDQDVEKMGYDASKMSAPEIFNTVNYLKAKGASLGQIADDLVRDTGISVKQKVGIFDYLKTPSTVFSKIGMKDEFSMVRSAHENYLKQLPVEINKITEWSKQVSPESNKVIFNVLDGNGDERLLDKAEKKVVGEVRSYLSNWAEKLNLPKDKRISKYITHIFEKGQIEKEFDPAQAKLMRDKVAGSVYNPFLQQRGEMQGYKTDTWAALDAYVKRATRKFNMDPALEKVKAAADDMEISQYNYVKSFIDRVNLHPTDLDNLVDNAIKSSPIGYKFGVRPTMEITQKARQATWRGLIGLNPGVALTNLSQGANTYAALGEKYTIKGYTEVVKNLKGLVGGGGTELNAVGVLNDSFIEDRTLNATKKVIENMDKGLFYMFNLAEKINRGACFWGAKAKAIDAGKTEAQAIEYAKALVRKTQFSFGAIDTPVILQSDVAKTLLQFQSYGLKQAEFLGGMIAKKDIAGIVRYVGASLLFLMTIGKAIGKDWTNMIPFNSGIGTPPTLQLPKGVVEITTGNPAGVKDTIRGAMSYIPAGGQIYKSATGIESLVNGGVYGPSGTLKYPSGNAAQAVVFGPNASTLAQDYFNNGSKPLGETQTEKYKVMLEAGVKPVDAYNTVTSNRTANKSLESDIAGETKFNLFDLLKKKVFGGEKEKNVSRGDILLDALDKQVAVSDKVNEVKQIFSSGLSKEKIESLLEKRGLGTYEEASYVMMKTLPIDSGARGTYLVSLLTGLSGEEFAQTIYKLAEVEVLTTGVTAKWLDDGLITTEQKKAFDKVISTTKGKVATGSKKLNLSSIKKIKVSPAKVATLKRISAPKLDIKTFKSPLETYNSKAFLSGFKTKQ